jgi:hypothetical protein
MQTRRKVARSRVAVRTASAPLRRLPEILVIGTQRGGTSSLFRFLAAHPDVRRPVRKEIEYFAADHHRGRRWYRAHFPIRPATTRSMDCTPQYLFHPHAARRAAEEVPDARIVALLREPVARAHSHWRHMATLGHEPLGFADAIAAEPERTDEAWQRMVDDPGFDDRDVMRFSYVRRGQYAEHLEAWAARFPPEQLLVMASERLFAEPAAALAEIERFLGLGASHVDSLANASGAHTVDGSGLDPATADELRAVFAPSNARLVELGVSAPWL